MPISFDALNLLPDWTPLFDLKMYDQNAFHLPDYIDYAYTVYIPCHLLFMAIYTIMATYYQKFIFYLFYIPLSFLAEN